MVHNKFYVHSTSLTKYTVSNLESKSFVMARYWSIVKLLSISFFYADLMECSKKLLWRKQKITELTLFPFSFHYDFSVFLSILIMHTIKVVLSMHDLIHLAS